MAVDDFNRDDMPDLAVASEDGGRVAGVPRPRRRPLPRAAAARQSGASRARWSPATSTRTERPISPWSTSAATPSPSCIGDGQGGFAATAARSASAPDRARSASAASAATPSTISPSSTRCPIASRCCTATGTAQFPTVTTFPVAARPSFLIVGDTNSDGHQDLVVGSQFSESVSHPARRRPPARRADDEQAERHGPSVAGRGLRSRRRDGSRQSGGVCRRCRGPARHRRREVRHSRSVSPSAATRTPSSTGDFDHDGRIDIAVLHRATQTIAILLNRSRQHASAGTPRTARRVRSTAPTPAREPFLTRGRTPS